MMDELINYIENILADCKENHVCEDGVNVHFSISELEVIRDCLIKEDTDE